MTDCFPSCCLQSQDYDQGLFKARSKCSIPTCRFLFPNKSQQSTGSCVKLRPFCCLSGQVRLFSNVILLLNVSLLLHPCKSVAASGFAQWAEGESLASQHFPVPLSQMWGFSAFLCLKWFFFKILDCWSSNKKQFEDNTLGYGNL